MSAPVTPQERARRGRELREAVPRSAHAAWHPGPDRPDPIALLQEQDRTRLPELVPIRYGRMSASPFTFLRGAALPMAADLARTPRTGALVQLCGDAHLANFGIYASPERRLVFDLNDFDESLPGPFEWDVKRLAASLEVAARLNGHRPGERRATVEATVRAYREAMARFAGMRTLDIWYAYAEVDAVRAQLEPGMRPQGRKLLNRTVRRARARDSLHALDRLTEVVDGQPRILADPPLLVPLRDLVADEAARERLMAQVQEVVRGYRRTLPAERRALLDRFRVVDVAHKVVGVGSVGTRCWIVLMLGNDAADPLFLQVKQAGPSVLERFVGRATQRNAGQRVVVGQRAMQAVSDIFLGWYRLDDAQDYYVRQLRDGKGGVDVERIDPANLAAYGRLCGWTLARAHARTGDPVMITGYLGGGPAFDNAVGAFARAYADQTERDHRALLDAIASERVAALPDL